MRIRSLVGVVVAAGVLLVTSLAHGQAKPRIVDITGNDQMKFSLATIAAKPGETLRIRLKSIGTLPKVAMGHNFVVLAKGTDAAAFANAAASAYSTGYIPPAMKDKVLATTTVVGPGETAELIFKVPTAPGSYTFLCSFPGHFVAGMKGLLVVK